MGSALTYARRYARFTLVGIAGEDDLDAPDIGNVPTAHSDTGVGPTPAPQQAGAALPSTRRSGNGPHQKFRQPATNLSPADSSATRGRLMNELEAFACADELTEWAIRQLPIKNTLTADDARVVEQAFQVKLEGLAGTIPIVADPPASTADKVGHDISADSFDGNPPQPDRLSAAIATEEQSERRSLPGKTRRLRNKSHLEFVAAQPCLICGSKPCDAHHIRFAQPRALGRKVSDEFTVPLCRAHHRQLHRVGDERQWWQGFKMDPLGAARFLWQRTNGEPVGSDTPR